MRFPLLALAALSTATPALAAPAHVATPAAPWEASSEGGVCRVQRSFEAGGKPHLIILEQNAPGPAVGIALAGPSLGDLRSDSPLRVSFAADHGGFDKKARIEPNREYGNVAILQGVWLDTNKPDPTAGGGRIDTATAEGVEQITVSQGGDAVTFATGSLANAARDLNDCTAQIMRGWGLDPLAQYALSQAVTADEAKFEYPRIAARNLRSGPVEAVALVDAAGKATDCRIIISSGHADIDAATCAAMTKARYNPARDAAGAPVASFWKARVNYAATAYEAQRGTR